MSTWSDFKFSRFASPEEVALRMRISRDRFASGEDESYHCEASSGTQGPRLRTELISYLKLIVRIPDLPETERDKLSGIPLKQGSILRKELRDLALIEEIQVNPGIRGKNFKAIRLTPKAKDLLR